MINKIALLLLSIIVMSVHSFTLVCKCKNGAVPSDEFNEKYCCKKVEKIYKRTNDPMLAEKLGMDRVFLLELFCNIDDTADVILAYMSTGLFEYVEINSEVRSISHAPFYPTDPVFVVWQWSLNNNGNVPLISTKEDIDIDMPEAWGVEQGDTSVIIAILDSGIKNNNSEFQGRLWVNKNEIPGNESDDDNNGYKDDINGWDFVNGDRSVDDDFGHGTAVASILASNHNDQGLVGVNGKSKIMVLKVSDSTGSANVSNLANAIVYAADKDAKVINLSFAGTNSSVTVQNAIQYAYVKGVVVCAGSGNNNQNGVLYPAKFAHVIGVGATDPMDNRGKDWVLQGGAIGGSNYGDSLDVVAPGDSVVCMYFKNGSIYWETGTSFATAFVSGLASLLISQNPGISPDMVTMVIQSTAQDQVGDPAEDTPGYDKFYGYGRINAYQALLKGEQLIVGKKPKALTNLENSRIISYSKFKNMLKIKTDISRSNSPINVCILDASGRVIRQIVLFKREVENFLVLPPMSRGVYFYSVNIDGVVHSGKILN